MKKKNVKKQKKVKQRNNVIRTISYHGFYPADLIQLSELKHLGAFEQKNIQCKHPHHRQVRSKLII